VSQVVSGLMHGIGLAESDSCTISEAHALRHTAATDVLRGGAHIRDVQAMLGHASLVTTQRYMPLVVADLRDAMGGRRYRR
jgi:site-specific recombinase XerD